MTWIVMVYNGLPRSITKLFRLQRWVLCFHEKNVFGNHLAHYLCVFQQRVARSIMCLSNVGILTVFRWTCLGSSCFNNGLLRSIVFHSFFVKRMCIDLLRTGRVSSILRSSRVSSNNRMPRSIVVSWSVFGIGWFDWNFLNCCTTCPSGRLACSEPNSLFQSCRKEIFGGGRGDMYTFSYMFLQFPFQQLSAYNKLEVTAL